MARSSLSNGVTPILELDPDHLDDKTDYLAILSRLGEIEPASSEQDDQVDYWSRKFADRTKYLAPVDEGEKNRLNLQHQLFVYTLKGKFGLAPLKREDVKNVLDIGSGTGAWAVEFARMYPASQVLGIDISSVSPDNLPPNCSFRVADAEDPWNYTQPFDYIHGRMLASCFQEAQNVVNSAFNALAPGGWLELQDGEVPWVSDDGSFTGTAWEKWNLKLVDTMKASGRRSMSTYHIPTMLEKAGFVDISVKKFIWPLGTWPKGEYYKTLGAGFLKDMMTVVGFTAKMMYEANGVSSSENWGVIDDIKKENESGHVHAYMNVMFVCGRKPLASS